MYHKIKIGNLSNTQISRLLNGHGVRISDGANHEIELSKEQLKKYKKALEKGKAMTLVMDPFQMQAHQFLRGSGGGSGGAIGRVNKYNRWVDTLGARDLIDAGMSKGASTIGGMGIMQDLYVRANQKDARKASKKYGPGVGKVDTGDDEYNGPLYLGSGVGRVNKYNRWVDALGARQVIDAGMSKGASTIGGMGVGRVNKYNRWVDTLGARDLIDAGMSKGASTIGGFGLKKRKPRKMNGRALMPAGY